jgi:glutamate racemase
MKPSSRSNIGLIDSGVGGLTVMRCLLHALPMENCLYLADTAKLPLGDKNPEEIIQATLENLSILAQKDLKLLIIACHTISCLAAEILEKEYPFVILTIADSLLRQIASFKGSLSRIAVLGTQATIASRFYQEKIHALDPAIETIAVSCPLLVPLIEEEGEADQIRAAITHYLKPVKEAKVDLIILACTHYPFLLPFFEELVDFKIPILDPAKECVESARALLEEKKLLQTTNFKPFHQFFVSKNPQRFQDFLGSYLDKRKKTSFSAAVSGF